MQWQTEKTNPMRKKSENKLKNCNIANDHRISFTFLLSHSFFIFPFHPYAFKYRNAFKEERRFRMKACEMSDKK